MEMFEEKNMWIEWWGFDDLKNLLIEPEKGEQESSWDSTNKKHDDLAWQKGMWIRFEMEYRCIMMCPSMYLYIYIYIYIYIYSIWLTMGN